MIETTNRSFPAIVKVIGALIVAGAITFLLAALLHLGIQLPVGFSEHQIIPAAIVEGLCWLFLSLSLYALFARKTWAWRVAVAAHVFAVAGVLLGITALALGAGPSTEVNTVYHRTILVVLVLVLALLLTPGARAELGASHRSLPSG